MKLTPEIEVKGLKAYDQVCAFESLRRRGLPWFYAGFTLGLLAVGMVMMRADEPKLAVLIAGCAFLFGAGSGLHWKKQEARYMKNAKFVDELEATYGDQLPWVQVEKHFAALDKLKEELAEEKRRGGML